MNGFIIAHPEREARAVEGLATLLTLINQ